MLKQVMPDADLDADVDADADADAVNMLKRVGVL